MKKRIKRVAFTIVALFILAGGFYFITEKITKYTGFFVSDGDKKNDFENCLKEKNITLFIDSEDSVKTLLEINLTNYLDDFKIINCNRNNQPCLDKAINNYPTWVINEGYIEGNITLEELSKFSKCNVPK
jgi:hypothetical protein